MAFRKFLQIVERRGPSRDVVLALLDRDVRDKTFFSDETRVEALAAGPCHEGEIRDVQADEEHQAFAIVARGPQRRLSAPPSPRSGLRHHGGVPHAGDQLSGRQGRHAGR